MGRMQHGGFGQLACKVPHGRVGWLASLGLALLGKLPNMRSQCVHGVAGPQPCKGIEDSIEASRWPAEREVIKFVFPAI